MNYDDAIHLDAESLAENGIGKAYFELIPRLRQYVNEPADVEELIDNDRPSYAVRVAGEELVIHSPELLVPEWMGWVRATVALFAIVNGQLSAANVRFYALSGGNDLFGIFLTAEEFQAAKEGLPEKRDWPYLPTWESPHYGVPR